MPAQAAAVREMPVSIHGHQRNADAFQQAEALDLAPGPLSRRHVEQGHLIRCACHGESQPGRIRDDVHSSSADGFGSILERAKFGVWHKFGAQHVQRYVDEVAFRWSNRVRKKVTSKKGKARKITLIVPVEKQIMDLIIAGIGRRISRTNYRFRTFPSVIALAA